MGLQIGVIEKSVEGSGSRLNVLKHLGCTYFVLEGRGVAPFDFGINEEFGGWLSFNDHLAIVCLQQNAQRRQQGVRCGVGSVVGVVVGVISKTNIVDAGAGLCFGDRPECATKSKGFPAHSIASF